LFGCEFPWCNLHWVLLTQLGSSVYTEGALAGCGRCCWCL